MSNKLYSMLEMASKGFPQNEFYALDMDNVPVNEVESFLQDGLRNFRAKSDCRSMLVRTGMAGQPEVKLYIATNLDAYDDELILSKMKESLGFISQRFGGYRHCFIILQEWTPKEDYHYSLNLMPTQDHLIIEAIKGNHYNLDRAEQKPTILKARHNSINMIKQGLEPDELMNLQRQLKQLMNNFIFENNCIYELSLLKERPSFYQIKRPGQLYKNPISKQEFYQKLQQNKIRYESRIQRKH